MTRYAIIEIRSSDCWYLMQGIFNDLFECGMINLGDPEHDSLRNPTGHLIFTGLTGKGLAYMEEHHPDMAEMAREFKQKEIEKSK